MKQRIITGSDLGALLVKAGVIPANTRRFVIDCEAGQPVKLITEELADERLLDTALWAGLEVKTAPDTAAADTAAAEQMQRTSRCQTCRGTGWVKGTSANGGLMQCPHCVDKAAANLCGMVGK